MRLLDPPSDREIERYNKKAKAMMSDPDIRDMISAYVYKVQLLNPFNDAIDSMARDLNYALAYIELLEKGDG